MKIILVNDDGYKAKGLRVLAKKLSVRHDVKVVAPKSVKSGYSHAMTFGRDIIVKKRIIDNLEYYIVDGTPCDCTKFALLEVDKNVDLIVSGINDVTNVGTDVLYSGTVNAGYEAGILGYKAICVSLDAKNGYYDDLADFIVNNLDKLISLSKGEYIPSVNARLERKEQWKGVKMCYLGERRYHDYYDKRRSRYHLKGKWYTNDKDETSDVVSNCEGYVTITVGKLSYESLAPSEFEGFSDKLCW